ncbi:MAG TPA: hypothetical protein VGW75_14845 [Solirubrobacteraceae bacterium]|jgi:uncharacterized repeat protein (TIGR01451 family)|nr:hypothetical protein [Solirubrobacteraceae bacterium]
MLRFVRPAVVAGLMLLALAPVAPAAPPPAPAFDFGARDLADLTAAPTISGTVWEEGDEGVQGIAVYTDVNVDGHPSAGEPATTTAGDGSYTLPVVPGANVVRLIVPVDYSCSRPLGCMHVVNGDAGQSVEGRDFTIWRYATVSGTVLEDLDGDGTFGGGDTPVEGAVVFLDVDGDGTRAPSEPSRTTGLNGSYEFSVQPGEHRVGVELDERWHCSALVQCIDRVTANSGEDVELNLLAWRDSAIRGTLFRDLDADGAPREPGEPVVDDGGAYVDSNDNGMFDPGEPSVRAEPDGTFGLGRLRPGTHVVRPLLRDGWACLWPDPCRVSVTSTSGSDRDAGEFGLADVSSDLSVTLARTPDVVVAGESVEWTVTVANGGPVTANNATLGLALPDGLGAFAVRAPEGIDCTGVRPTLRCELGDLLAGPGMTISLVASVQPDRAGRALPLTAVMRADNEDPDVADNRATLTSVVTGVADLRTTATLPAAAEVGEVVDLVVELRNDGPSDAASPKVVATLPEGIDPVVEDLPEGCTVDGREVTCVASGVAVGSGLTRSIPVRVGAAAAGRALTVPVEATSAATDPTPGDAAVEAPLQARAPAPAPDPKPAPQPQPETKPELVVEAPPAPAEQQCRSTRVFDVHLSRRHGRLRSVTITLDGRRLAVRRRNGRFTARVDLRGRPEGEWVLGIRAVTVRGKVLRGTRTYHTCTTTKQMGLPPL